METLVTIRTTVRSISMAGCRHTIFMADDVETELRRTHKSYYCTICGRTNYFPDVSDLEALERQIVTVKDQRDTARYTTKVARADADHFKASAIAHKGHHTRTKKRVAAGVCPCCNRTFQNLARHMKTKHKDFVQ